MSCSVNILLVEDFHGESEPILRELRDAELTFECRIARSELEFKEQLENWEADVIISPYSLKGTNALKLLSIARRREVTVPFILLAFNLAEDIAIDLLAEGVEDYILRSTLKRLPVAIRKALQRHKTQIQLQISQKMLKASEESLRNMVRNAPIAVAMFDAQMNYMVVSQQWLVHEKKKESDIIGRNHYEVVPDMPERWKEIHRQGLEGRSSESENDHVVRADGTEEIIRWKLNPWYTSEGTVGGVVLFMEDITERHQAMLALERSEARLRDAQALGQLASWELDLSTGEIFWSDQMFQIHGLEKQPVSIELFMSVIHPDDVENIRHSIESAYQGKAVPMDYRIIRADTGEERTVYGSGASKVGDRMIGTVQDVTDRVRALREAQEVKESLAKAQRIAKIGSWEWELGTDNVRWSDEMYRIYEREERHITLNEVKAYIHPEDRDRVNRLTQNDLNTEINKTIEYRLLLSLGKVKHVVSVAEQIVDIKGRVVGLVGTLQDVTEQKEREELIRTLSLVASETINGVLIHNPDGTVIWANRGFTEITGYSDREIIGKEPWQVLSGPLTDRKLVQFTYEKLKNGRSFSSDNRLLHKDGHHIWINTVFTPVLDDDGNVTRIVSIGTDITKQKELEELQRRELKRLEALNKKLEGSHPKGR